MRADAIRTAARNNGGPLYLVIESPACGNCGARTVRARAIKAGVFTGACALCGEAERPVRITIERRD